MSEGDLKYAAPVSRNLVCPICHDVFVSPVITAECGHSFCRKCIYQALTPHYRNFSSVEQTGSEEEEPQQHTGECPLCRATVHKSRVHANHALAGLLSELLVRCRNEERGCAAVVAVSDKQAHEAVCEFAAEECPYWTLGCSWNGTKQSLKHHLQHDCPFDKMKDFVTQTTSEIAELKKQLKQQAREIRYLKRALGKSSRMELELNEEEEDKKQKEEDETEEEEDEEAPQTDKKRKGNARQRFESIKDSASSSTEPSQSAALPTLVSRWNVDDLRCIYTLGGDAAHSRGVTALEVQNNRLFSGSHDCSIRIWDMRGVPGGPTRSPQVECSQALTGHKYSIWALQCTNDGRLLYSGSSDGTIRLWNVAENEESNNECLNVLQADRKVYALKICDGLLLSSGTDREVKAWDTTTNTLVHSMPGHKDCIWSVAREGDLVMSGSDDRSIKIWDLKTFKCIRTLTTGSKVLSLAVGHGMLCMGTTDCKVGVWDLRTMSMMKELSGHVWEVWQTEIRSGFIFSGSFDHTIKIWDTDTFRCVKTLEGHKGYIHALHATDECLVSGSGDKTIKLWATTLGA
ncbi:putative E3 ubiquitin ligase complex SCF subunit sconB [Balamuthia mandrillaris]